MTLLRDISIVTILILLLPFNAIASTSNYALQEVIPTSTWDGTNGSRLQPTSTYGDESVVSYTLPWTFTFYSQPYASITADSNGNIWFSPTVTTSAHSFSLSSTGRGPVIAAWNDDLSSSYLGGVFIQHKTDAPLGDRVTIEWRTETQTEEGLFVPNSFETILFPDGKIRIDYKAITTALGYDSGSGISRGDASNSVHLDVTSNFASVPTLTSSGQRSFLFIPPVKLQVNFAGTGTGTVISTPQGIACNTDCSANFSSNDNVKLSPVPFDYSLFTKWSSGPCLNGTGDCTIVLTSDTSVTAQFDKDTQHQVKIGDGGSATFFPTIQAAYNAAASVETIKLWGTVFTENVSCTATKAITLQGGYNGAYTTTPGMTMLQGVLTISSGAIVVDGMIIK